ncbi:TIGR02206 family membrane protein [Bacillus mangrovi]|uniref:TIGR02206 family membrane protein n=1 Tax=Metabacillus mangrovi TaxID=1491830 RepID=A0A7X2S2E1_9BACI|nr:TIGR02206 family membrane protein [Metabacillus mangrovi]MTH51938.1 TIGR02206 family membrane protein [Metabacillus mangrovi]
MNLFNNNPGEFPFAMFEASHTAVLGILFILVFLMYLFRKKLQQRNLKVYERALAVSLIVTELLYHVWLIVNSNWSVNHALPLELCNISFIMAVLLLLTGNRLIYEILLFIGLLGASQALLTPVLEIGFPHFRFFHFFYTHVWIFAVPLYYTWVKGYRPTFHSVWKMVLFLNILLPAVLGVNFVTGGNYMFLAHKPSSGSLLDLLGPYPWYILSLEAIAAGMGLVLWLVFREKTTDLKEEKVRVSLQ